MGTNLFDKVIELNLSELVILEKGTQLEPNNHFYCRAIIAYLSGDLSALQSIHEAARLDSRLSDDIKKLIHFRMRMRQEVEIDVEVEKMGFSDSPTSSLGEFCFLAGLYCLRHKNYELSKDLFLEAHRKLTDSPKKALKALFNHYIAESHIRDRKRYFVDLIILMNQAIELGDECTAGLAALNIGSEFHKMGALQNAFFYLDRAIQLLSVDFGTVHFEAAIAKKCLCLVDMGHKFQAELELESIKDSPFEDTQSAVAVIKEKLHGQKVKSTHQLFSTWKKDLERFRNNKKRNSTKTMTPLEEQVLALVSESPKTKFELISRIYGENISYESSQNRLNNLLIRIKKKYPGLVVFKNNKYHLFEQSYFKKQNLEDRVKQTR